MYSLNYKVVLEVSAELLVLSSSLATIFLKSSEE